MLSCASFRETGSERSASHQCRPNVIIATCTIPARLAKTRGDAVYFPLLDSIFRSGGDTLQLTQEMAAANAERLAKCGSAMRRASLAAAAVKDRPGAHAKPRDSLPGNLGSLVNCNDLHSFSTTIPGSLGLPGAWDTSRFAIALHLDALIISSS